MGFCRIRGGSVAVNSTLPDQKIFSARAIRKPRSIREQLGRDIELATSLSTSLQHIPLRRLLAVSHGNELVPSGMEELQ